MRIESRGKAVASRNKRVGRNDNKNLKFGSWVAACLAKDLWLSPQRMYPPRTWTREASKGSFGVLDLSFREQGI